jgi:hypothetical protein
MESLQTIGLLLTSYVSSLLANPTHEIPITPLPTLCYSGHPTHSALNDSGYTRVTPHEVLRHYYAAPPGHHHTMTTTLMATVDPCLLIISPTPHLDHIQTPNLTVTTGLGSAVALAEASWASLSDQHSIALAPKTNPKPTAPEILSEDTPDTFSIHTETTSTSSHKPSKQEFQCRICLKPKDRKFRADTCEKKHYGIKDYPCSGKCGDPDWYVP